MHPTEPPTPALGSIESSGQTAEMALIAIDGPTGVGKSTTAREVASAFDAPVLLDPVSVSPLLDDYYTGEATPAAALHAELAFLHSRADLLVAPTDGSIAVSDFSIMRTAPFSEFLDDPEHRARVLAEMRDAIDRGPRIDVLVLLDAPPRVLHERVRHRDRDAEAELTLEHLVALVGHFASWREAMRGQAVATFELDTTQWDPRRSEDRHDLVAKISEELAGTPRAR